MKTLSSILALALVALAFLAAPFVVAQDLPPVPAEDVVQVTDTLASFIVSYAVEHPWIVAFLAGVGLLRTIFKPVRLAVEAYVKSTADTGDDAKLDAVERSWLFRAFAWFLDFGASIKLPPPKPKQ